MSSPTTTALDFATLRDLHPHLGRLTLGAALKHPSGPATDVRLARDILLDGQPTGFLFVLYGTEPRERGALWDVYFEWWEPDDRRGWMIPDDTDDVALHDLLRRVYAPDSQRTAVLSAALQHGFDRWRRILAEWPEGLVLAGGHTRAALFEALQLAYTAVNLPGENSVEIMVGYDEPGSRRGVTVTENGGERRVRLVDQLMLFNTVVRALTLDTNHRIPEHSGAASIRHATRLIGPSSMHEVAAAHGALSRVLDALPEDRRAPVLNALRATGATAPRE